MLQTYQLGEYTIDFSRQKILKGKKAVRLPQTITGANAWKFLERLISAKGRILTYDNLDEIWWDDLGTGVSHKSSLKTWASAFDKALGDMDAIKNKYGIGYYWDGDAVACSPVPYMEALWSEFYRGIVRDQPGSGRVRELIDFYCLPQLKDSEGAPLPTPFAQLQRGYVTAGSGFGKSALLHMILLTNLLPPLLEAGSEAVSENSRNKAADYGAIRTALFGEGEPLFPVFISAASANDAPWEDILDLAQGHAVAGFRRLLDSAHDRGRLLFLIDSLDEAEHMDDFLRAVAKLPEAYPQAKILLTSRFLGRFRLPFACAEFRVAELSDEAVTRITGALLSHRSAGAVQQILNGFRQNPYLSALAQNPFMLLTILEERNDRLLCSYLNSIVSAIFERRWNVISYGIKTEVIELLLGYLACLFVYGDRRPVSQGDLERAFLEAEKSLQAHDVIVDIPRENMDQFIRMMSCHSGILNIVYEEHVESFVFQDELIMCWLAACYVSRVLECDPNICERDHWDNAVWLHKLLGSFARRPGALSREGVNTLILTLLRCSGVDLQKSVLHYLLFRDAVSLSPAEKLSIREGFRALVNNTFGENEIVNDPESDCYQMLAPAMEELPCTQD